MLRQSVVIAAIALGIFAAAAASAAVPSVDASIEPSQIEVGESARLTILTSGSGALSVTLPVVSGLEFRVVGQSHQIQIINGARIESTSTIVRVTPEEAGVFTIPGVTPTSPPLVLRVNPSGGGSASVVSALQSVTASSAVRINADRVVRRLRVTLSTSLSNFSSTRAVSLPSDNSCVAPRS